MNLEMILFDLDGTLLPMDNDAFTRGYFKLLTMKMAPRGYAPEKLIDTVWAGTAAMVKNDGSRSNEDAFWETAAGIYGEQILKDRPVFDEFYAVEFAQSREYCGFNPAAAQTVRQLKTDGLRTALATNPIFPALATQQRIRWAGLEPEEFELVTTYENTGLCKPNPAYYLDVAQRLGVDPAACLMVGNDVGEDMQAAEKAGMRGFLLKDWLINRENRDISLWPNGSFPELLDYVRTLC